ncbi:hypothetical protein [Collinsella aerofaciens]
MSEEDMVDDMPLRPYPLVLSSGMVHGTNVVFLLSFELLIET